MEYSRPIALYYVHVPSDRAGGREAGRIVGPLHDAGTLGGPDGSSESRRGGIPDPDRTVPNGGNAIFQAVEVPIPRRVNPVH